MLYGLHIEMAALKSLGSLLYKSGWTGALVEADVPSSGTAESFLSAASVTRTRQMHQVAACSLYKLLKTAYNDSCADTLMTHWALMSGVTFAKSKVHSSTSGTWCCLWSWSFSWSSGPSVRPTLLSIARHWIYLIFFASNKHQLCTVAIPIHLRDMLTLENTHPGLAQDFQNGNFVVHKTNRDFSALAHYQGWWWCHWAHWKPWGQPVGVPVWNRGTKPRSHWAISTGTENFQGEGWKLSQALKDLGNPFQEDNKELYSLDTK